MAEVLLHSCCLTKGKKITADIPQQRDRIYTTEITRIMAAKRELQYFKDT